MIYSGKEITLKKSQQKALVCPNGFTLNATNKFFSEWQKENPGQPIKRGFNHYPGNRAGYIDVMLAGKMTRISEKSIEKEDKKKKKQ